MIFFPQRPALRLTPHGFSPSVLGKILKASAREPSFQEAAEALDELAEVTLSSRQVTRLAEEVGHELEARRDQQTRDFQERRLDPAVTTRPALAVVEVDGGRLQIREAGEGPGAHQAAWREDKVALLATAALTTVDADPEPELPACFRDPATVEKLVREVGGVGPLGTWTPPSPSVPEAPPLRIFPHETDPPPATTDASPPKTEDSKSHAPEFLVRTFVASACDSERVGPMVAAEAHRRNFPAAARGAFVGDGGAWIWKLQRQYFPGFQAIVDFVHVVGYLFAAARAAVAEPQARWELFQAWAQWCWQGQVTAVLDQLRGL
ncbi:MAG: hypothetical protein JOZ58_14745, partial [Acetobacteraceae bacterium]|nr:hypothetical protein [Acetobacteraceae bacterium]